MKIEIESKTVEKAIDLVSGFLQKLINPSLEEIGGLFADNWRAIKIKNTLRNIQSVKAYVEKKGIDTKKIPLKVLAPLLDGMSLEEDESLQEKWVALFVNYIDSRKNYNSTVFPYILTQLSTNEAAILEFMNLSQEIELSVLWGKFNADGAEIANIERLGLIREVIKVETSRGYSEWPSQSIEDVYIKEHPTYAITELGIQFTEACSLEK